MLNTFAVKTRFAILVLSAMTLCACGDKNEDISIHVKSVTVTPSQTTLFKGETLTLKATVSPANATDKRITWSSDYPEIATVTESGLVTAVSKGTAVISATAGGVSGTCTLTVAVIDQLENQVQSVTVLPESITIGIGTTEALSVAVLPETATHPELVWVSSDQTVAIVSEEGVVTGIGAGEAVVTATAGNGVQGQCEVTVDSTPSFTVQRYNRSSGIWTDASAVISSYPGDSISLRISVLRDEGEITWSVEPAANASYENGKVWFKTPGNAVLSARAAKGARQDIPLCSNISDTFLYGGQANAVGSSFIMGSNAQNAIVLTYSDGTQTLPLPVSAYTLSVAPENILQLSKGEDSWSIRSGTKSGEATVRVKMGDWVDTVLCTVMVTDNASSGGTEPMHEEEIRLDD